MATDEDNARDVGRLLAEHRAEGVVLLDVGEHSGWTDWFVIATVAGVTQLRALTRHVDEFAVLRGLSFRGGANIADDEEWVLLDLGNVVVHLMSARAREFYDLEKLWFQARSEKVDAPGPSKAPAGAAPG